MNIKPNSLTCEFKASLNGPADPASQKLLIVLHGLGDSSEGYSWLPEIMNIDSLNYLLVNAPNQYFEGYSWYEVREGWLKDDELSQADKEWVVKSRQKLFALLDELFELGYQEKNIAFFGFSQGCVMSLEVALNHAKRFAGFCAISGYLFNRQEALSGISTQALKQKILMTHGVHDEVIPFFRAAEDASMMQAKGLDLEFHRLFKTHTIDPVEELPLIREFLLKIFEL
jgi:phospholipase/carboxylesterase